MIDVSKDKLALPPEQQAIRDKCFHPTGTFVEFKKEEIEQSIPERFEKIVRRNPERIAVKTTHRQSTYTELSRSGNQIAHALLARCDRKEETIALRLITDITNQSLAFALAQSGDANLANGPSRANRKARQNR